jgi:hypothetical protein
VYCELQASLDKADDSVINEANPVDRAKPLGNLCNNYCMRSETYIEEIASRSNTGTVDISKVTQVKKRRQSNAWLNFLTFIEVPSKPLSRTKGDPETLLSRKQGDCVASHLTSCSKNSIKESQSAPNKPETPAVLIGMARPLKAGPTDNDHVAPTTNATNNFFSIPVIITNRNDDRPYQYYK